MMFVIIGGEDREKLFRVHVAMAFTAKFAEFCARGCARFEWVVNSAIKIKSIF